MFWAPHLWYSSFHLRASSNSPPAAGSRVKTCYPPSWYWLACLSWSPVWSWRSFTLRIAHMARRCSTVQMPMSLALYHLYEIQQIFISIKLFYEQQLKWQHVDKLVRIHLCIVVSLVPIKGSLKRDILRLIIGVSSRTWLHTLMLKTFSYCLSECPCIPPLKCSILTPVS